ncbi:MAG: DEAD/DEAH box helicase [Clostridiales Family XIII bacterium]|jgi:ATP-dependent RNA helicase DeaD|nr:DEAD/DEAH box helicase [Clostridiales Family XIII bacterium]
MTFQEMNISADILRGLKKMNFEKATPVQKKAIEPMKDGRDVVVLAPTGSGKTAAFGIPILENLDVDDSSVQALIICPTRELAMQTVEVFHDLMTFKKGVRICAVYGGANIETQIKTLKKKPQIVVATPGRLMDHLRRRTVRLNTLKTVVLDEADRMLDMGFSKDVNTILAHSPKERQTVMFSATMPPEVMKIAETYLVGPQTIKLGDEKRAVDTVAQYYAEVGPKEKEATLVKLLRDSRYQIALVFCSRKHLAKSLARTLEGNGFRAAALQGNMSQAQRNRVMADFKSGRLDILVATDVAARGIDVNNIDVVVNFDLPQDADSYIHRIGRTGRAGKTGDTYAFVSQKESYEFRNIVKRTNSNVQLVRLEAAKNFISLKQMRPTSTEPASGGGRHKDRDRDRDRDKEGTSHRPRGKSGNSPKGKTIDMRRSAREEPKEDSFERIILKEKVYKEERKKNTKNYGGKKYGKKTGQKNRRSV